MTKRKPKKPEAPKTPAEIAEIQMASLEDLQRDYKSIFSSAIGQRVLADLKKVGFQRRPIYNGDATQGWINEGKRQFLNHILTMMDMDIEQLRQLQAERLK